MNTRLMPADTADIAHDPVAAAKAAKLRYVTDTKPGICRRKREEGDWEYVLPSGGLVTDEATLARIRSLVIPPAYTDVWICPLANGHLQATGRDARGRKQYRYHPRWREIRDTTKYDRMLAFAEALPGLRARVEADLARPGLPREKVLAAVVRLLETTNIRVGNEQYVRENDHYGLTTLRNEHVDVTGATLHFHFVGKSGKAHQIDLQDRRLAKIVQRCQEIEGHELFQYIDDAGQHHAIHSDDVNAYLHEAAGQDFTAKDFRTWSGTILCALTLGECGDFGTLAEAKRNVTQVIKRVSEQLGNTPSVCRKCYIHPTVLERYLAGTLKTDLSPPDATPKDTSGAVPVVEAVVAAAHALGPEEQAVLRLLRTCPATP